jgi:photosystem II stability/assembly factor-like uncharacterized protein
VLKNTGIGTGENLCKISTPNSSVIWITASGSGVYRSIDGGETYTKVLTNSDIDEPLALDANTAWAMCNFSIKKTINGGASWTAQPVG